MNGGRYYKVRDLLETKPVHFRDSKANNPCLLMGPLRFESGVV